MNDNLVVVLDRDDETTERLARWADDAGFGFLCAERFAALQSKLADSAPAIMFACCDDDPEGLADLLACDAAGGAREIVVTGRQEHSEALREQIAQAGALFLAKPLDAEFVKELLSDVRAELNRVQTGDPTPVTGPPLDQCGMLRGSARPMRRIYRLIRKVAPSHASVLITGESGTGKELVAQAIHMFSNVADGPMLAVNCGAIPSELIESELFGHERGSFSGAERTHRGYFERADGGSLFLDEIVEMPAEAQVRLLRVLETGRFQRVGGEKELSTRVRVIAATNQDPAEAVDSGLLRQDLFYRVAQFSLWLPPLRERGDDIVGLARIFLHEFNEQNGTDTTLSAEAEAELESYSWPGNVRELRSVVERAYIVGNSVITPKELPPLDDQQIEQGEYLRVSVGSSLDDSERRLIFATLKANDGDKRQTAKTLGISLKTLYNRLNRYAEEDRSSSLDEV